MNIKATKTSKYNMYRYWNAVSVGYAQCYSMRTITLHTIQEVMERTNVTITFDYIRTSKSTYYLHYDQSHCKTYLTIIPFSILLQILASPAKK